MKKRKHEFRRVKRYVFIYLVILLLGLLNLRLKAQTPAVTWTGAIDSAWSRAGNWSAGKIPTSADDVVIAAAPSFQPVVMSEASCKGIMIEKGAHVKFAGDVTLHVHGDFLNEGEVFSGRGKVRFAGSGIQKITSASPLSFYTLEM
ncbi:MAG TPA: hypothetical protein VNJ07_09040, partial [Chitinophagales bacterium]|nr:hypothetical protein [Chitinophagales bacterium]